MDNDLSLITARAENLVEKYALKPLGLNSVMMKILLVVIAKEKVFQKEINDYILTTPANVSQRIQRMVQLGYIKRINEEDNNDRRKNYIVPTTKGKELFNAAIQQTIKVKSLFIKDISPDEVEYQLNYFKKFAQNIKEAEKFLEQNSI